jgi:citronellol/citronellal dehydrogenase
MDQVFRVHYFLISYYYFLILYLRLILENYSSTIQLMSFQDKTVFITGGSRGIGKAIALRLAKEGANIVIAAKSIEENPRLGGTIFSAAEEVESAGGKALAVQCDIRFEDQVLQAVEKAVGAFGGIDILINNASAIYLSKIEQTEPKAFGLMHDINVKGTFFVSKACIPHLKNGRNAHILNLSPPINLDRKWFTGHLAYTMSKYNMTMIALGLSVELKKYNIAANSLWPKTTIATAAVRNLPGGENLIKMSRSTKIISDATFYILSKSSADCTGNCFIDEEVLVNEGITNFDEYAMVPGANLYTDLFL